MQYCSHQKTIAVSPDPTPGDPRGGTHYMSEVYTYIPLWWPPFQAPLPLQAPTFWHLMSVLIPSVFFFQTIGNISGSIPSNFGKTSAQTSLILAKVLIITEKICSVDDKKNLSAPSALPLPSWFRWPDLHKSTGQATCHLSFALISQWLLCK